MAQFACFPDCRLDNFDGPAVAEKAIEAGLAEEAYEIYKKFNKKVEAVKVRVPAPVHDAYHCRMDIIAGYNQCKVHVI